MATGVGAPCPHGAVVPLDQGVCFPRRGTRSLQPADEAAAIAVDEVAVITRLTLLEGFVATRRDERLRQFAHLLGVPPWQLMGPTSDERGRDYQDAQRLDEPSCFSSVQQ
ncbi:hypothetical protein D187_005578 [Cystobacter fuscus DSM 2262]|uniref:Uncharacterized protein n=1 Tax=Cystobacter fuscus (strain ATCC 25194 / DSM 2262 / NBRC 100088 / M29) TaxID=1242864 RepID=S9QT20_CYSF2|nr:hypothetical protein D187_005578 [Cystobacter fuscus DSM 2262]